VLPGRRGQRWAASLGLLAIWLQIAFIFPHVCPDEIAGLAARAHPPGFAPAAVSDAPDNDDLPLCPLSQGRNGDGCLIYATAYLASHSLLPDTAKLDPAALSQPADIAGEARLPPPRAHHLLFETRAPPFA